MRHLPDAEAFFNSPLMLQEMVSRVEVRHIEVRLHLSLHVDVVVLLIRDVLLMLVCVVQFMTGGLVSGGWRWDRRLLVEKKSSSSSQWI